MNVPSGSTPPAAGGRSSWALWLAAAVVAVAAIAIVVMMRRAPAPAPVAAENFAGLRLEGPHARFTWTRDPRAGVYRIETYDAMHRLIAAAVLRDTSIEAGVLLPDSARGGTWRVVGVSPGGTEMPGELAPFRRP